MKRDLATHNRLSPKAVRRNIIFSLSFSLSLSLSLSLARARKRGSSRRKFLENRAHVQKRNR